MTPCERQLCVIEPRGFSNLTLEEQGAMILACKLADSEAYRKCEARHKTLVDWIKATP